MFFCAEFLEGRHGRLLVRKNLAVHWDQIPAFRELQKFLLGWVIHDQFSVLCSGSLFDVGSSKFNVRRSRHFSLLRVDLLRINHSRFGNLYFFAMTASEETRLITFVTR